MPYDARRNSIIVLIALCVPLLIFIYRHYSRIGNTVSYYTRCGPDYRDFLLFCAIAAAIACFTAAGMLFYAARKRIKRHPLNGITYSWSGFAAAVGILALSPLFNLRSAPCWVTPLLYATVAGAASWAAIHTTRRLPTLLQVPSFEIEPLLRIGQQRLEKLQSAPGTTTAEEDAEFAPYLEEMLAAIRAETAGLRADREGAQ